jgi:hypothetical protein
MTRAKKKYTREERELAAVICAIAASTPDLNQSYSAVCWALDIDPDTGAGELAFKAWNATQHADHPDAEAEALIRTGWCPRRRSQ